MNGGTTTKWKRCTRQDLTTWISMSLQIPTAIVFTWLFNCGNYLFQMFHLYEAEIRNGILVVYELTLSETVPRSVISFETKSLRTLFSRALVWIMVAKVKFNKNSSFEKADNNYNACLTASIFSCGCKIWLSFWASHDRGMYEDNSLGQLAVSRSFQRKL